MKPFHIILTILYMISPRSCAFADACDMVSVRKDGERNLNLSVLINVIMASQVHAPTSPHQA